MKNKCTSTQPQQQSGSTPAPAWAPNPLTTDEVAALRQDLREKAEFLRRVHPGLLIRSDQEDVPQLDGIANESSAAPEGQAFTDHPPAQHTHAPAHAQTSDLLTPEEIEDLRRDKREKLVYLQKVFPGFRILGDEPEAPKQGDNTPPAG